MGSAHRPLTCLLLVTAALLGAPLARADESAGELSKRGYELLLANRCEEAIAILGRSAQLAPDARTLVNLARCEAKTGHLRAAREHFTTARDLAQTKLPPEMVAQLDGMTSDVDKRLPRVKLTLAEGAPSSTRVKEGDLVIPRTAAETGWPVDPGETSFVVSADGHEPKTFTVTVAEGETRALAVTPGPALAPARPLVAPPRHERSPLKTVGVITLIAGAGALAVGGVFGGIAMSKKGSAEDAGCSDRVCPDDRAGGLRDDARSAGTVSTIGFVAGGVLAAAGLGMFLLAPSASADRVGMTMSGRF